MNEEHIFILEWGQRRSRLLYLLYDSTGELELMEGTSCDSEGMMDGLPENTEQAAATFAKLRKPIEEKYDIKIQTLFVLLRCGGKRSYIVKNPAPYLKAIKRGHFEHHHFNLPQLGELPHHAEPFDVYESDLEARVFAIHANQRELIQQALLEQDCFVESFLSLPRIGVKSREQKRPGLMLGMHWENSIVLSSIENDLTYYREFPFSLQNTLKNIASSLDISHEKAERVLGWIMTPPSAYSFDLADAEFQQIYLSQDFANVKNQVADELDRLAIMIKQDLEQAGVWEFGFDQLYLFGEGSALYRRFTFLRDVIPLEPTALPSLFEDKMEEPLEHDEFAHLIRLGGHGHHLRLENRRTMESGEPFRVLKNWTRRLLGK